MKKSSLFILIVIFLIFNVRSEACLSKDLNIGIINSANDKLLAELISVLINERTGTTVNIKVFDQRQEIYDAVKLKDINIVIENTDHAVKILNIPGSDSKKKDYDASKREFREQMNLVLLKPLGFMTDESNKDRYYYAALIPENVLIDFPALSRVINKLKGITDDWNFNEAVQSVNSGRKINSVAKDFLKQNNLL